MKRNFDVNNSYFLFVSLIGTLIEIKLIQGFFIFFIFFISVFA